MREEYLDQMSEDCMYDTRRKNVIVSNIASNVVSKMRYIFNKSLRAIKLKNDDTIYIPRSESERSYIPTDDGSFEKCTKEEFFDFIKNLGL